MDTIDIAFRDSVIPLMQVLGLGMNFLTADDMSAILAVKLRRRLGFGMWAKLHLTGMHVEGKVDNYLVVRFSSVKL